MHLSFLLLLHTTVLSGVKVKATDVNISYIEQA